MRLLLAVASAGCLILGAAAPASAQRADSVPADSGGAPRRHRYGSTVWCSRTPRPFPDCDAVFLSEFDLVDPFAGTRALVDTAAQERRQPFAVGQHMGVTLGVLRNLTTRSSLGATVGVAAGEADRVELKARYRRWLTAPGGPVHVDLAAGPVRSTVALTPRSGPAPSRGDLERAAGYGATGELMMELGDDGDGVGGIGAVGAVVRGDVLRARGRTVVGATGGFHFGSMSVLLLGGLALWVIVLAAVAPD